MSLLNKANKKMSEDGSILTDSRTKFYKILFRDPSNQKKDKIKNINLKN